MGHIKIQGGVLNGRSPATTLGHFYIIAGFFGACALADIAAIFLAVRPDAFTLSQATRLRLLAYIFADIFCVTALTLVIFVPMVLAWIIIILVIIIIVIAVIIFIFVVIRAALIVR